MLSSSSIQCYPRDHHLGRDGATCQPMDSSSSTEKKIAEVLQKMEHIPLDDSEPQVRIGKFNSLFVAPPRTY